MPDTRLLPDEVAMRERAERATPTSADLMKGRPRMERIEVEQVCVVGRDKPELVVVAICGPLDDEQSVNDADFIANAREDVTTLLSRLDAVRAELERERAMFAAVVGRGMADACRSGYACPDGAQDDCDADTTDVDDPACLTCWRAWAEKQVSNG